MPRWQPLPCLFKRLDAHRASAQLSGTGLSLRFLPVVGMTARTELTMDSLVITAGVSTPFFLRNLISAHRRLNSQRTCSRCYLRSLFYL